MMGVSIPPFVAKAFGIRLDYDVAGDKVDPLMEIDEECYLGKDGDLEDCADFDPPKMP